MQDICKVVIENDGESGIVYCRTRCVSVCLQYAMTRPNSLTGSMVGPQCFKMRHCHFRTLRELAYFTRPLSQNLLRYFLMWVKICVCVCRDQCEGVSRAINNHFCETNSDFEVAYYHAGMLNHPCSSHHGPTTSVLNFTHSQLHTTVCEPRQV